MKVFYLEFSFYYNFLVKGYEKGHEKTEKGDNKVISVSGGRLQIGRKGY